MSVESVAAASAAAVPPHAERNRTIRVLAGVGIAGGLLFAGMSVWEHAAGLGSGHHGTAGAVNQGLFAVAMACYVALAVGVALARPGGAGRTARLFPALLVGAWVALLAGGFLEAFSSIDSNSDVLAPIGGLAQAVGLVGLGVTVARAGRWSGWRRWFPAGFAAYFVGAMLVPAFAGVDPHPVTESLWALGYAGLGVALLVESLPASPVRELR